MYLCDMKNIFKKMFDNANLEIVLNFCSIKHVWNWSEYVVDLQSLSCKHFLFFKFRNVFTSRNAVTFFCGTYLLSLYLEGGFLFHKIVSFPLKFLVF